MTPPRWAAVVGWWLTLTMADAAAAQTLTVETYRATVITKTGQRYQGLLDEVTDSTLCFIPGTSADDPVVPLSGIGRVVIRRSNRRGTVRSGAVAGSLLFGLLTANGLRQNPTSSPVAYGLTLFFGVGTGAALGAGGGWLLSSAARRTIRPNPRADSPDGFRRQLEPFSVRYQTDLFRRIQP
jgi:hypothetical protein